MQLQRVKTRVNRATTGFSFSPDWLKKEKRFSHCFEHDVIFLDYIIKLLSLWARNR